MKISLRWFPHRHTGYVSINGYVHPCTYCGRLPAGAVHAGFYGTDPDSPDALRYKALLNSARPVTPLDHDR